MRLMLRKSEMAKVLGVNKQTIQRWMTRHANPMPYYRVSPRVILFDPDEVIDWIKKVGKELS